MIALSPDELHDRFAQVKLLALDVDGVLTDGGLYYTETGEELKKFNVKDGLGIQQVMQAGIPVAIISAGSAPCTLFRAKRLGVTHTFIQVENKLATLKELCNQLQISLDQVAYVGDDLIDEAVLQAVGCPLSVADAMPSTQALAIYVTEKAGGQGAVREICDRLIRIITEKPEQ